MSEVTKVTEFEGEAGFHIDMGSFLRTSSSDHRPCLTTVMSEVTAGEAEFHTDMGSFLMS